VTDWSVRPEQQGDVGVAGWAPVTSGNGSAPVGAPVENAGPRQVLSVANLRLAMLAVVIVVVGASAGYITSLLLPKQYAAHAEILYSLDQPAATDVYRDDVRLNTQVVLLRSRAVLGPVAFGNGMTPEDLAKNVSAKVVGNSEIIEVEVRDRTREHAKMLLNGAIDRYLSVANKDWQDPVHSFLQSQLGNVQQQLQTSDVPGEDATKLEQRQQVLRYLLDPLQPKPSATGSGPPQEPPSRPPARVLTSYPVAAPVSLDPLFAAATGAAMALVVAAFVVLLVVRRRLRS
jgi:hypothetical protein